MAPGARLESHPEAAYLSLGVVFDPKHTRFLVAHKRPATPEAGLRHRFVAVQHAYSVLDPLGNSLCATLCRTGSKAPDSPALRQLFQALLSLVCEKLTEPDSVRQPEMASTCVTRPGPSSRAVGKFAACLRSSNKNGGSDWRDAYLIDTGPFVGVSEGRRILGRYQLTEQDLARGTRFEDGICEVLFAADIHHHDPAEGGGLYNARTLPYDIPNRSLLPIGLDNLLLAGRCISGDHIAHASYRVTGNAVATDEAAGLAAAMSLRSQTTAASLDIKKLRARLAEIRAATPAAEPEAPHRQLLV